MQFKSLNYFLCNEFYRDKKKWSQYQKELVDGVKDPSQVCGILFK